MAKNNFKAFQRNAVKVVKSMPTTMGKMALQETSDNFRRGGYENEAGNVVPWAPRKAAKGRKGRKRRALLVQSGRLRRSPRIVSTTATSVTLGTDVPYAEPLHEGNTDMPARPFFPTRSRGLQKKIVAKLTSQLQAALKR